MCKLPDKNSYMPMPKGSNEIITSDIESHLCNLKLETALHQLRRSKFY